MLLNRIRLGVLCLGLLALGTTAGTGVLCAQSTTQGGVAGTVVDPTGAVITGASITLHNVGTNAEIKLTSDASGYFKAPLVPPGVYTVAISAPNFAKYTVTGVAVTVGSLTELQPTLSAGSTIESVAVTGEAPVLHFESPEVSETLTSQEVVNLPLNGGRWSDLALLTPATTSDANGFGLIVFRGISPLMNNVEIDGADDNQAFFSEERGRTRAGYSTSQIGVAEFQVNTGVYSAEYGRAIGGVINSVTKSGTNALHGQAYFLDRDNDWGAINPFTTYTSVTEPASGGAPKIVTGVPFAPKDWRKRWGFGAGGPLIKDKLFWFYAYDQYKRNFPGVAKPATPATFFNQFADMTAPAACTENAGKTATTDYSKISGVTNVAGDNNACALAWRVYGGSYATAAKQYNQLLYGSAVSSLTGLSSPGLLDDLGTTPRTGDEVLNTPKLDWQINDKEHVSFLYHRLRWDSPGGVQTQTSNNYSRDAFGTDYVKLDYGMAKLDSLIAPDFSNEIRFQYGRELDWEGQQRATPFTSTYLTGTSGVPVSLVVYGDPSDSTTTNYGFNAGMPYYSFRTAYPAEWKDQLGDTANWTYGAHSVKFGFDFVRNSDLVNNLYKSNGEYTYTTFSDLFSDILQPSGSCDSAYSQLGVGKSACYYGYTQGFGTPKFSLTTVDYGLFTQDDWKVSPHLTVNIGLRYDYEHVPPPFPSLLATSLLNTTPIAALPQAQIGNHPNDVNNFGPRVGLSWDPFGKGTTVVHAGYGFYYGRIINEIMLNAYEAAGSPQGQYTMPSVKGKVPDGTTAPAFPQVIANGKYSTPSIDFFQKHFANPEVHEFDLSIQRTLGHSTFVTVDYLGALARKLPNFLNLNLNPSTMHPVSMTVVAGSDGKCGPVACGKQISSSYYTGLQTSSYGSVTEVASNINSSYNGVAVDIQNRGNKWATFDVNYTYSHALDFNQNQSTSPSANGWWDPWSNPRANYGNSTYNVPNRVVGWALLEYPVPHSGLLRYVTDGWHLNPVVSIQNGLPYSYGVSGNIKNAKKAAGTVDAYQSGMNGSGNSGYLLQLGRNTKSQPTTYEVDTRIQKDVRLNEKLNLELVGEAFNLLNHVNVTVLSSTAYSITGCDTTQTTSTCNLTYQSYTNAAGGLTTQSGFGSMTNANSNFVYSQRQVQLGVKLDF